MIYWVLFLIIFLIILIVVLVFTIGNFLLRKMVESFLPKKEGFTNFDKAYSTKDECSQLDHLGDDLLYSQTGVNIPLAPNHYDNYVGEIYTDFPKKGDNLTPPPSCNNSQFNFVSLIKPAFYMDGIWKPHMEKKNGWENAEYSLDTKTGVFENYYSNKMLEHNFKVPQGWRDYSSTPYVEGGDSVQWFFNNTQEDPMDNELYCWENIFTAGITNELKKQEALQYPKTK